MPLFKREPDRSNPEEQPDERAKQAHHLLSRVQINIVRDSGETIAARQTSEKEALGRRHAVEDARAAEKKALLATDEEIIDNLYVAAGAKMGKKRAPQGHFANIKATLDEFKKVFPDTTKKRAYASALEYLNSIESKDAFRERVIRDFRKAEMAARATVVTDKNSYFNKTSDIDTFLLVKPAGTFNDAYAYIKEMLPRLK